MTFCQYCLAANEEDLPFHCESEQEFFAHLRDVHGVRVVARTAEGFEVERIDPRDCGSRPTKSGPLMNPLATGTTILERQDGASAEMDLRFSPVFENSSEGWPCRFSCA
jgi:hypothetical protein